MSDDVSGADAGRELPLQRARPDRVIEADHRLQELDGIGRLAIHCDEVALDQSRSGRAAEVGCVLRDETVQTRRRNVSDQAALGLRIRYPTISRKTPMLMAESARLKTGQK